MFNELDCSSLTISQSVVVSVVFGRLALIRLLLIMNMICGNVQ